MKATLSIIAQLNVRETVVNNEHKNLYSNCYETTECLWHNVI